MRYICAVVASCRMRRHHPVDDRELRRLSLYRAPRGFAVVSQAHVEMPFGQSARQFRGRDAVVVCDQGSHSVLSEARALPRGGHHGASILAPVCAPLCGPHGSLCVRTIRAKKRQTNRRVDVAALLLNARPWLCFPHLTLQCSTCTRRWPACFSSTSRSTCRRLAPRSLPPTATRCGRPRTVCEAARSKSAP